MNNRNSNSLNKLPLANGRINILEPNVDTLFKLYDKIPANQITTFRNPTQGIWNDTQLSLIFFSKKNITIIQNAIRNGVYIKSNKQYIIGEQDQDTLNIIMRSIFLESATNLPYDIKGQVERLNNSVLDYCISNIYGEAQGYLKYLKDASTMYVPMPPPILSYVNDKQLELKTFF